MNAFGNGYDEASLCHIAQGGSTPVEGAIPPWPHPAIGVDGGGANPIIWPEMLRFHNTLSGRIEDFVPIEPGRVKLYTCGPTVYDLPHIGNWRAYIFEDLLKRFLVYRGFKVDPRDEHHGCRRQDDPRSPGPRDRARRLHPAVHRGLRPGPRRAQHPPRRPLSPGDGAHPGDGRAHQDAPGEGHSPTGRMARSISPSTSSRLTGGYRRSISRSSGRGAAATPTSTKKRTSMTSPSGRRPRRESRSGRPTSGRAGRAGTSNARP